MAARLEQRRGEEAISGIKGSFLQCTQLHVIMSIEGCESRKLLVSSSFGCSDEC